MKIDFNRRFYTLVGAILGLVLFFVVGLFPSLLYGAYAGLLLAGGIVGTPVGDGLLVRGLTVFGSVLGVLGIAGLFAVAGAVVGALVAIAVRARPEHLPAPAPVPVPVPVPEATPAAPDAE